MYAFYPRDDASMEAAHQYIHFLEDGCDEEETLFVAMDRLEFTMLGLSLMSMHLIYPCLRELNASLQKRLVELVRVQQPEWIEEDDDEEA